MVLKGINRVYTDKIRSNGLERSQLGTQYKNQIIWSWKESFGYTMIKLGQMVLKGVNRAYTDKNQVKWSWKELIGYTMIKSSQMVM